MKRAWMCKYIWELTSLWWNPSEISLSCNGWQPWKLSRPCWLSWLRKMGRNNWWSPYLFPGAGSGLNVTWRLKVIELWPDGRPMHLQLLGCVNLAWLADPTYSRILSMCQKGQTTALSYKTVIIYHSNSSPFVFDLPNLHPLL